MSINVKGVIIGEGRPKICVPLTGRSIAEIERQALEARESAADLAELRIDYFVKENGVDGVSDVLETVRKNLGYMPVIFTFRTKEEGGECEISIEDYKEILIGAAESGMADIIDVEYNLGGDVVRGLCKILSSNKTVVIVSNHDFDKTLPEQELIERLDKMKNLGADIVKMAMMPKTKADVMALMKATADFEEKENIPIITMSMGKLGSVSRLCGEFMGSAVTFAAIGETSAPGQMPAQGVKQCLDFIHNNI